MASNVGAGMATVIGRERELLELERRLAAGARLITLLGPGGTGKTTLARALHERRVAAGEETHFVDLVGVADPGLVPAQIAAVLGVSETAELDAAAVVSVAMRESSAVMVLDNIEELTEARGFLSGLLRAAPSLRLVATSRLPLGIPGESAFHVPPLDLPLNESVGAVESSPAGRLFLERAGAVGRLDELDEPMAAAIAALCRRLDGLPLALELAASRTRIMSPAVILRHLSEPGAGVLARAGGGDDRHRSLDAVLSWSLDLLEPQVAEVLGVVAICPGGFDLAIAQALAPRCDVLGAVDVLVTHGLLVRQADVEGEPWFRLLETIRAAALDRLDGSATAAAWRRLASHLSIRVAGTIDAHYSLDLGALRRLDALLDDVRAALDWAEVNDPSLDLAIAGRFSTYWAARGRSREGIPRLRAAVAAWSVPTADLAVALNGLTTLTRQVDGSAASLRTAADAARIARHVGAADQEVEALRDLVINADHPDAAVTDRLRALLPTLEQPLARYQCLSALAQAAAWESGFSEAVFADLRDAATVLSGTPYRGLRAGAAANLAQLLLYADRPGEAHAEARRALELLPEASAELLAWVHAVHATAASSIGRLAEAAASLRSAVDLGGSRGGSVAEVMVAAVAVAVTSDAPLLAAKVFGATVGDGSRVRITDVDRTLAEHFLAAARRVTDPVAFEIALRDGELGGVDAVIAEVLAHVEADPARSTPAGPMRLRHGTLTPREVEVLALVGAGRSDAEIAAAFFISRKAASVHVSNAKAKLGLKTRLEAALWARDRGIAGRGPG